MANITTTTPAGGDLAGTFPNPTLRTGIVTADKIAALAITNDEIADGTISEYKLKDSAKLVRVEGNQIISGIKVFQHPRTTLLVPTNSFDQTSKYYVDTKVASGSSGGGGSPSGAAGGDLAGSTYPNPIVTQAAISGNKIAAGSVLNGHLAQGAVSGNRIAAGALVFEVDFNTNLIGTRKAINFNAGSGISIFVQDDPVGNRVNVVISGGATGAPSGPAGGDLTGTYPNPTIRLSAVSGNVIAANSILNGHIAQGAISGTKIGNGFILNSHLAQGSVSGNVIAAGSFVVEVQNNSALIGSRKAINFIAGSGSSIFVQDDPVNNRVNIILSGGSSGGGAPSGPAGGDLAGSYPNPTIRLSAISGNYIAANSILTGHLANYSVSGNSIASGAILLSHIGAAGTQTALNALRINGTQTGLEWYTPVYVNSAQHWTQTQTFDQPLEIFEQSSSPGAVTPSYNLLYYKNDHLLYSFRNLAGSFGEHPINPNILKGDLPSTDGTTNIRLPVGANGQFLVADSVASLGLRWVTLSGSVSAASTISGSGTIGYLSKFTSVSGIGNSVILENAGGITLDPQGINSPLTGNSYAIGIVVSGIPVNKPVPNTSLVFLNNSTPTSVVSNAATGLSSNYQGFFDASFNKSINLSAFANIPANPQGTSRTGGAAELVGISSQINYRNNTLPIGTNAVSLTAHDSLLVADSVSGVGNLTNYRAAYNVTSGAFVNNYFGIYLSGSPTNSSNVGITKNYYGAYLATPASSIGARSVNTYGLFLEHHLSGLGTAYSIYSTSGVHYLGGEVQTQKLVLNGVAYTTIGGGAGTISGSGTIGNLAKFSAAGTIANALITENAGNIALSGTVNRVNYLSVASGDDTAIVPKNYVDKNMVNTLLQVQEVLTIPSFFQILAYGQYILSGTMIASGALVIL